MVTGSGQSSPIRSVRPMSSRRASHELRTIATTTTTVIDPATRDDRDRIDRQGDGRIRAAECRQVDPRLEQRTPGRDPRAIPSTSAMTSGTPCSMTVRPTTCRPVTPSVRRKAASRERRCAWSSTTAITARPAYTAASRERDRRTRRSPPRRAASRASPRTARSARRPGVPGPFGARPAEAVDEPVRATDEQDRRTRADFPCQPAATERKDVMTNGVRRGDPREPVDPRGDPEVHAAGRAGRGGTGRPDRRDPAGASRRPPGSDAAAVPASGPIGALEEPAGQRRDPGSPGEDRVVGARARRRARTRRTGCAGSSTSDASGDGQAGGDGLDAGDRAAERDSGSSAATGGRRDPEVRSDLLHRRPRPGCPRGWRAEPTRTCRWPGSPSGSAAAGSPTDGCRPERTQPEHRDEPAPASQQPAEGRGPGAGRSGSSARATATPISTGAAARNGSKPAGRRASRPAGSAPEAALAQEQRTRRSATGRRRALRRPAVAGSSGATGGSSRSRSRRARRATGQVAISRMTVAPRATAIAPSDDRSLGRAGTTATATAESEQRRRDRDEQSLPELGRHAAGRRMRRARAPARDAGRRRRTTRMPIRPTAPAATISGPRAASDSMVSVVARCST